MIHWPRVCYPDHWIGIWSKARLLRKVSKYTNSARLGELSALISEIIRGREMMESRPGISRANLTAWEDNGMVGDIAFSQELIELDIIATTSATHRYRLQ